MDRNRHEGCKIKDEQIPQTMRTLLSIAVLLISIGASAQIGEHKDPSYDPPAWAMLEDSVGHVLGLTNQQMKQVQTADENYRANAKAGDKGALEKRDADLRAILLPTQYTQWKEVARARRAQMKP